MLIAKLTLNAQAERRAMTNIQRLVVECEGHDRLRMQGVDQVNAFIIRDAAHEICAMENDIAGVVLHSRGAQQQFQWHASPFANSAPAFDTVMAGDLATQRHLPDLSHGEGERSEEHTSELQSLMRNSY